MRADCTFCRVVVNVCNSHPLRSRVVLSLARNFRTIKVSLAYAPSMGGIICAHRNNFIEATAPELNCPPMAVCPKLVGFCLDFEIEVCHVVSSFFMFHCQWISKGEGVKGDHFRQYTFCVLFNSRPHLLSRLLLRSYFFFTSSNFFSLYHFAAFSTFCVKSF